MSKFSISSPSRIYVGTYAKYNNGSIAGAWLDMSNYSDKEEFEAACQELHGEGEHEFMFQDWEGIPDGFILESNVSDEFFEWAAMKDSDKELLAVYKERVDSEGTLEEAQGAYMGKYGSPEEWAEDFLESCGELAEVPEHLRNYIDFKSYAHDAKCGGTRFAKVGYKEVWVFKA